MSHKMTKIEAAVHLLLNGEALTVDGIARRISMETGRVTTGNEASTLLSQLASSNLGPFIQRRRQGRTLFYTLVEEARSLTLEQAFGLISGEYSLASAGADHPALLLYMDDPEEESQTADQRSEKSPLDEALQLQEEIAPAASAQTDSASGVMVNEPDGSGESDEPGEPDESDEPDESGEPDEDTINIHMRVNISLG